MLGTACFVTGASKVQAIAISTRGTPQIARLMREYPSTNGNTSGTVSITDGTTVTYTPNEDWYGDDEFTYTISDGTVTTTATVQVTVYALGQWASMVSASSQRMNNTGDSSAAQVLGAPNSFSYGDAPTAWSPQYANNGL